MPEYKNVFVTYLDILGFRELVEQNKRTPDEILDLLALMKTKSNIHIGVLTSDGTSKVVTATQAFSDLIIRQVEFTHTDFKPRLGSEMAILSKIQFELLTTKRRTLVRGGVSKGRFYMSSEFVFGPAMVRSYELEQLAVFPRIVIDRDLIRELSDENRDAWKYILRRGEDGIFFIDYLNAVIHNESFTPTEIKGRNNKLAAHKVAAEEKLEELSSKKESVRQKSLWLAQYHNSVIEKLVEEHTEQRAELVQYRIAEEKLI